MARVSVIIPAYGPCPYLPQNLRALLDGTRSPDEIIVSHSGTDDPTESLSAIDGRILVLHSHERLLAGAARNRGAGKAQGRWLAFLDADVRPCPGWLAALLELAEGGSGDDSGDARESLDRLVVGSIGTATSGGYWGMVNWISEFSELAPWHPRRRQVGGASASMMVPAEAFRAAGGFAEAFQPAEDTLLFARLRKAGHAHWFEPAARVDHYNVPGFASFHRHQDQLGRHSALVRQAVDLPGSVATRIWPIALGMWIPRFGVVLRRLLQGGPRWWGRALLYLPGMLLGAWIWNWAFLSQVVRPSLPPAEP